MLVCTSVLADVKISELTQKTASEVNANDVTVMVDTVANATRKIKLSELFSIPALSTLMAAKQASFSLTTNGDIP